MISVIKNQYMGVLGIHVISVITKQNLKPILYNTKKLNMIMTHVFNVIKLLGIRVIRKIILAQFNLRRENLEGEIIKIKPNI